MPLTSSRCASLLVQVQRPAYARDAVRRGIVHLGLGAFHRAHQAVYTEAVLNRGDLRWGIVGVHLRGRRMADALRAQDHLYSVTERHAEQAQTRVVGAVQAALFAPDEPGTVLSAIADPGVHVITLTVTEKGYSLQPATGDLDLADAELQHDLGNTSQPRSTLGVLAAGLLRRAASAPVTLVCCDNMAANGPTLQRLLSQYAERACPALLARLSGGVVAFPSTMVDRIVPAATAESLAYAEHRLGLRDEAAIVCEPFTQWVIEDRFAGPRPAWEDAGAVLTGDVRPFQAMKLRLLNGTHSAIAYAGQLCGLETVSDAMAHPLVGAFARRLMLDDLRATVVAPSGYDVLAYCGELLKRFENPSLAHRTQQIAMDGTQKVPVRWLPALRESLAAGAQLPQLERALAAWLHCLASGHSDSGVPLAISDPGAPALAARLRSAGDANGAVRAALAHTSVFGDAAWPADFISRLAAHLSALRVGGMTALLSH